MYFTRRIQAVDEMKVSVEHMLTRQSEQRRAIPSLLARKFIGPMTLAMSGATSQGAILCLPEK
jgi:hypothetical protein